MIESYFKPRFVDLISILTEEIADKVAEHLAGKLANTKLPPETHNAEFFDERSVERKFGLKRRTLQSWRHRGRGPPWVRAGRKILYPRAGLSEFLSKPESRKARRR